MLLRWVEIEFYMLRTVPLASGAPVADRRLAIFKLPFFQAYILLFLPWVAAATQTPRLGGSRPPDTWLGGLPPPRPSMGILY